MIPCSSHRVILSSTTCERSLRTRTSSRARAAFYNAGKSHGDSFARLVVLVLPALRSLVLHAARARLRDSDVAGLLRHHEPVPHTHALVLFALAGTRRSTLSCIMTLPASRPVCVTVDPVVDVRSRCQRYRPLFCFSN